MSKTKKTETSLALQLLGIVFFVVGVFFLLLFPIGTVGGVILMIGATRLGYKRLKIWKCEQCGHFFEYDTGSIKVGQVILLLILSVAAVICSIALVDLFHGCQEGAERDVRLDRQPAITAETTPQNLLEPIKRSLRVNINTASSEELQSLPGIGPARADLIIAHRPYKTFDDLKNVKGIPHKVADDINPLVTTDGRTERLQPSK